jgi:hypothetical protein
MCKSIKGVNEAGSILALFGFRQILAKIESE